MKFILFCNLPYAFGILKPLEEEIKKRGYEALWYVPDAIKEEFPYKKSNHTSSVKDLKAYSSDAILVPGNEVPHFLRGVKVQIFHGLAGEKKGHFRIRDYFDLYLTQGPYFTKRFEALAKKHKNFQVSQTGWCKLDDLYTTSQETLDMREKLLLDNGVKHIVLYAPTFSPSLTSADKLISTVKRLGDRDNILVIVKFHDKMDKTIIEQYQKLNVENLLISNEKDITKLLQISDLMISDTSSVVYEFILLDKPVVTLESKSENINWLNLTDVNKLEESVVSILDGNDEFINRRHQTIKEYHPYDDGNSSVRMINAIESYIQEYGVPTKRDIPFHRKIKINNKFGWFV